MIATRLQVKLLNGSLAGLELRIDEADGNIEKLEARVGLLEGRHADKITNIPEEKGENLIHIVTTLTMKLSVMLSENDLVSATRVGRVNVSPETVPESHPSPKVVRLGRLALEDQVLIATLVRCGITTKGTWLPAPHRRFYVNERLMKVHR
ncbi:unnamed protein product [Parnassius apollo]|uniref:(apollo) hypothetical protein n=1 Tax=Parnassius apollo TaxID=110799 RepID=A0A8S3YHL9_PARAO|nr:unnamed protein product [Parnassius apollo]